MTKNMTSGNTRCSVKINEMMRDEVKIAMLNIRAFKQPDARFKNFSTLLSVFYANDMIEREIMNNWMKELNLIVMKKSGSYWNEYEDVYNDIFHQVSLIVQLKIM